MFQRSCAHKFSIWFDSNFKKLLFLFLVRYSPPELIINRGRETLGNASYYARSQKALLKFVSHWIKVVGGCRRTTSSSPGPTTVDKSLKHIKVYPKLLSLLWAVVAGEWRIVGGKAFYYNKCSDWKRSCCPWKVLKGLLICRFMFTHPPLGLFSSSLAISILSLVAHEKGLEIIITRGSLVCII